MRKVLFFATAPVLLCWFFGYRTYQTYVSQKSNVMLARGIAHYRARMGAWPRDFDSLEPYVDEPDTVRLMNPVFQPVSDSEAYFDENQWSVLSTQRVSCVVVKNADGSCSISTRGSL